MKRQQILPAGCHDADSAAKILNVTKLELLARMREIGWLYADENRRNLPRQEMKYKGYLTTQERGYHLKGKREIGKSYSVMLLTQLGFQELKKMMNNEHYPPEKIAEPRNVVPANDAPTPKARVITIEPVIEKPHDENATELEHQKCLQLMADWGLPIAAGRR